MEDETLKNSLSRKEEATSDCTWLPRHPDRGLFQRRTTIIDIMKAQYEHPEPITLLQSFSIGQVGVAGDNERNAGLDLHQGLALQVPWRWESRLPDRTRRCVNHPESTVVYFLPNMYSQWSLNLVDVHSCRRLVGLEVRGHQWSHVFKSSLVKRILK